ncbi:hypothetical protein AB0H17_27155 [Streptomyces olivoreticuli]
MTDDDQVDVIAAAIDTYFEEVDVETFETDDLAWTIMRALKQAAAES